MKKCVGIILILLVSIVGASRKTAASSRDQIRAWNIAQAKLVATKFIGLLGKNRDDYRLIKKEIGIKQLVTPAMWDSIDHDKLESNHKIPIILDQEDYREGCRLKSGMSVTSYSPDYIWLECRVQHKSASSPDVIKLLVARRYGKWLVDDTTIVPNWTKAKMILSRTIAADSRMIHLRGKSQELIFLALEDFKGQSCISLIASNGKVDVVRYFIETGKVTLN